MKVLFMLLLLLALDPSSALSISDRLTDGQMLTAVQRSTFDYFWTGAEANSGAARERYHLDDPSWDPNTVAIGGTGMGVMAILVGIERGFITRQQGFNRLSKIVNFLQAADRFHGVWPHWLNGITGRVVPFSQYDDGGDLVETANLAQGLVCVGRYFAKSNDTNENALAGQIYSLLVGIEWDWYRQGGQNILYWHWSPNYGFKMNMGIMGFNEALITYVMAAASPTHGIPADVYHLGWANGGGIKNDPSHSQYGYHLPLRHIGSQQFGGPLYWSQYSFLGLDPRGLVDKYADYGGHNTNHTLINRAYCVANPKNYKGYGPDSWGLTSSYSIYGYDGHSPTNDLGVISPTAAVSSIPYTPQGSMAVIRHLYGGPYYGKFGFYDAYSEQYNWTVPRYLAIDQGPMVVMIENMRTGLLWNLFMGTPEVQTGLTKLGFTFANKGI